MNPVRTPWTHFPEVVIHALESTVKKHDAYSRAKNGHLTSAQQLVSELVKEEPIKQIAQLIGEAKPILVAVHAVEGGGTNVIPMALAVRLSLALELPVELDIVQINRVSHTGASGYHRLATPPLFSGDVQAGKPYLLVDDFIGQGGTLANL